MKKIIIICLLSLLIIITGLFSSSVKASTGTELVINEIMPGTLKAIEIYNPGINPINLSTVSIEVYHQGSSLLLNYPFLPGTSIAANGFVVLHLYTGQDSGNHFYLSSDHSIFWNSGGAVILTDTSGTLDFVRFNGSVKNPPADTNWTGITPVIANNSNALGRDSSGKDTDDGSDWIEQSPSLGSPNVASHCYFLTISTEGNGAMPYASFGNSPGCNPGYYSAGTSILLSGADPETNWQIFGWAGTIYDESIATTNTVLMPDEDHTAGVVYTMIPLEAPTLIAPDDDIITADETISFQWSEVVDAESYTIQFSTGDTFENISTERNTDHSNLDLSDLQPGKWYWRVKATGQRPDSEWSHSRYLTILHPGPEIVGPINGATTSDHTPNFDWKDVPNVTHYVIQISPREDFSILPINHFVTQSWFAPGMAMINQEYYWRVIAFVDGAWSDWSEVRTITITGAPGQPQPQIISPLDGETTSDHTPTFDWEDIGTAARYRIQISKNENFGTLIVNQLCNDSDFTPGVWMNSDTYYWRIQAMGGGDVSWFSFKRVFTIQ